MSLHAAYGTLEYTPAVGLPFGRMSHHPVRAEAVHSPLTARLLLFGHGNDLVGLLVLDQIRLREVEAAAFRLALREALGVPTGRFMIAATHTHNSPGLSPWRTVDAGFELLDQLAARVKAMAEQLRGAMEPVTLCYARRSCPGIAKNRRAVYRAPDGREQTATHGKRTAENFIRMEGADEDELRVVLLRGEGGKLVAGIVNFPCHTTTMYGVPQWSADYPGVLRDLLAEQLGGPFIFVNGFAGDQSPAGGGGAKSPGVGGSCERIGRLLAEATVAAVGDAEAVDVSRGIEVACRKVRLANRVPSYAQVDLAWDYLQRTLRGEKPERLVTRMYGYGYHFGNDNAATDEWLSREIIARWELYRRTEVRRPMEAIEAQVLRIGELAIAGLPGEPFACFGEQVRAKSALPQVLCVEHANGFAGYLPPASAFELGGYECCLADQSRFEPDAGRKLTRTVLQLIKRLSR